MFDLKPGERLLRVNWSYGYEMDGDSGSFWFAVAAKIPRGEEEARLRQAIRDYYASLPEDNVLECDRRSYDPNWGDAVNEVKFERYGFRFLHLPIPEASFRVDHDEIVYEWESLPWYRNYYRHTNCPDQPGIEWQDEHTAMCNDRCPACNREIEPYKSEEIDA